MRTVLGVLVGVTILAVIALGGLWLWDREQADQPPAEADANYQRQVLEALECDEAIKTLRKESGDPTSLTSSEKQAAVDIYVACWRGGIAR
ncbi:MAG: hypothetical protein ABIY37_02660 [Devosia sp.]